MRTNRILLPLLSALLLLFMGACSTETEFEFHSGSSSGSGTEVNISGGTVYLNFPSSAGSATIQVEASKSWTASFVNGRAKDWCSVSAESGGKGTVSVTVSVKENPDYDERSASVLFQCGDVQRTIVVTQKQKDAMLVSGTKFELPQEGGTVNVEVKSNTTFRYTVADGCSSWITPTSTKGLSTSTVSFKVSENPTLQKREGEITFTSSVGTEKVKIYQDGETPTMILSTEKVEVGAGKETFNVEVRSNLGVTFSIPSDCKWLREKSTKTISTNTFTFEVDANEAFSSRSTEITFRSSEKGMEEKVSVIQAADTPQLILGSGEYNLGYEGGALDITLKSNMDVTFSIPSDCTWIKAVETKALTDKTFHFTVEENGTFKAREAVIVFSNDKLGVKDNVTVKQMAEEPTLILGKTEYDFDYEGGPLEITLKSNMDIVCSIPADCSWIKAADTKAVTDRTYSFTVEVNDTFAPREAVITFSNEKLGQKDMVLVRQKAEEPALIIGKTEYTFGYEGGPLEILLQSNLDIECSIPADCKWIKAVDTKAISDRAYNFTVEVNDTFAQREAVITFSNAALGKSDKVRIIQEAETPTLIMGETEYTFGYEGGPLEITLRSNLDVEYSISGDCNWIKAVETKTVTDRVYNFTVEVNDTFVEREAFITFSNAAQGKSDKVRIFQEAETPTLVIGEKQYTFGYEGGPLTVKMSSNLDLDVLIDPSADWISAVSTKAVIEREHSFTVAANGTRHERNGYIVFRNEAQNVSDTVKIFQERIEILASSDTLHASRHGCILSFDAVGTDPSVYRIMPQEDWIAVVSREKVSTGTRITVEVLESTLKDFRDGKVFVYPDEVSDPDTVVVRQWGVLPEFSYTVSSAKTVLPDIEPEDAVGFVSWGDGEMTRYVKGLSHSFVTAGEHTVTVEVDKKKKVPFTSLENGMKLNLKNLRDQ